MGYGDPEWASSSGVMNSGPRRSTLGALLRQSTRMGGADLSTPDPRVSSSRGGQRRGRGISSLIDRAKDLGRDDSYRLRGSFDPFTLLHKTEPVTQGKVGVRHSSTKLLHPWDKVWAEVRGAMLVIRQLDDVLQQMSGNSLSSTPPIFKPPCFKFIAYLRGVTVIRITDKKLKRIELKLVRDGASIHLKFDSVQLADSFEEAFSRISIRRRFSLKDFDFIAPIGAGAAGKVFLVRDQLTKQRLALKCVSKQTSVFDSANSFRHTLDERLLLERMVGQPYCSQLRGSFQTRESVFFVMEFCGGGDLFYHMSARSTPLPEDKAVRLIAQVILAIEKLHGEDYIYRDLKPENILLNSQGDACLSDFGLSKRLPDGIRFGRTDSVCGTHSYVAPEMIFERSYGRSVDLWTLGIFVHHVLLGKTPFKATCLDEVRQALQRGVSAQADEEAPISTRAKDLIERLLNQDAHTRLGCRASGFDELKDHDFFEGVHWERLFEEGRHRLSSKNVGESSFFENPLESSFPRDVDSDAYALRNFNVQEWRDIEMDGQTTCELESDDAFWPLQQLGKRTAAHTHIVGFDFATETRTGADLSRSMTFA